jgi:hypothetical protein
MEVLVEYDYVAQNPDELSIKKGERIRGVQRKEEGWYEGELVSSGRRGVFPDNFVKPIKTPPNVAQKMSGFQKQHQQIKSPENTKKNAISHIGFKGVDGVHQNGNSGKNNQQQQQQPPPTSSPPPPPPPSTINQININNLNNINNKSNPPLPIRKPLKRKIIFSILLF